MSRVWKQAAAVSIPAVALASWAVRGRSSSVFAPSVWRADRGDRSIALTFDDGPSESTPAILDLLATHDARATFFQCGANVRRLPLVARAVLHSGHEIGNHSDTHPMFAGAGTERIRREIERAQSSIERAAGCSPRLFRAPFGVRWFGLREAQAASALTGVMWTVIGRDWKLPAPAIAARLRRGIAPGSIVCLHDGRLLERDPDVTATLDALRLFLPVLRNQGYRSVTVSELICQTKNS